jgi:hypothetical protein
MRLSLPIAEDENLTLTWDGAANATRLFAGIAGDITGAFADAANEQNGA